jgi:hypothetical protein
LIEIEKQIQMKNILLVFIFLGAISFGAIAQTYELTPFIGYTLADKFNFDQGTAGVGDGFTYGATLSMVSDKVNALEFTYSRQETTVSALSEYHQIDMNSPAGVNYILIGGTRLFPLRRQPIEFFAGVNFGAIVLGSKSNEFATLTKMAVGFNGGMKYFFTKKMGVRIQPNLNFPITNPGGEYWWNPATGGEASVPSKVPFLQFGFLAGMVYKF